MARRPVAMFVTAILVVMAAAVGIVAVTGNGGLTPTRRQVIATEAVIVRQSSALAAIGIRWNVLGPTRSGAVLDIEILRPTSGDISKLQRRTDTPVATAAEYLTAATRYLHGQFGSFVHAAFTTASPEATATDVS